MSCMFPCPVCGGDSVCFHYYKTHWPVCERCKVRWLGGYNLITVPDEYLTAEAAESTERELRKYTLVCHDGPSVSELWRRDLMDKEFRAAAGGTSWARS
jgi:hypothetical protein